MAVVVLDRISKRFQSAGAPAVDDVSLLVEDGEFMVLLGPSGCGKSTTLRMIAGLETITSGELRIDDRVMNHVPAKDRDIAMVFQSYALYPHMNVQGNLAFGLQAAQRAARGDRATGAGGGGHARARGRCSSASRTRFRAASASASRSAAPSCATPRCSCSTSRSPISTRRCACAPAAS